MENVTIKLVTVALTAMVISFTSCASGKPTEQQIASPSDGTEKLRGPRPCFEPDPTDRSYMAGWGTINGSIRQESALYNGAIKIARINIVTKLSGHFKGMATEYGNIIGGNRGNDIASKLEDAVEEAIDKTLNDVSIVCQNSTEPDNSGMLNFYVGIRMYRDIAADVATVAAATVIKDNLTEDEKLKVRFQENNFKEQYKKAFNNFKSENQNP